MPKCTWRDRPGDNELCSVMASPGHSMCPRHEFLAELATQKKVSKELEKANTPSNKPRNRAELLARGYHFKGQGHCRGCNQLIEWYDTPAGRNAPYNLMPHDDSPAVCHFATCTRANHFRRAS